MELTNNILIAEFMGYKYYTWQECKGFGEPGWKNNPNGFIKSPKSFLCRTTKDMKYPTSWDWLYPVIEKIISLGYYPQFLTGEDGNQVIIYDEMYSYSRTMHNVVIRNIPVSKEVTMLQATYTAVLEFIKWYNQNKHGINS